MSQVGVIVTNTEVPPTSNPYDTSNAFVIGLGDWGAASGVNTPVAAYSLSDVANTIGPRSSTNATLYDALDAYFHEGGIIAYIGRVVGPNPTSATVVLQDVSLATSLTATAQYTGNYGNALRITLVNTAGSIVITLADSTGNILAVSPAQTTLAGCVAWAATTGLVTFVAGAGGLPVSVVAVALTGGSDDRTHATLTSWQNALNNFLPTLGPGQVLAPGQTNTNLSGIWSTLALHALNNNRVAIADMDDGSSATTLITGLGNTFNSTTGGAIGFWAGNLSIPGTVPGTTRSIAPSPVIAALCARADTIGNPNAAAAGFSYPLRYVLGSTTILSGTQATYSQADLNTLNGAGINTFANRYGNFENYGFVSSVLKTVDTIFWQFNHQRMRMALTADFQLLAEPFVFSQLDGQGADMLALKTALTGRLISYYTIGALFGATASDAFSVNTGPTVNTPSSLQAGQLNAVVSVRLSPFAQLVSLVLNAVPITQSVPVVTA